LFALDAHLERTAQLEDHDPWLEFFFDDVHECLSQGRLILERTARSFQERTIDSFIETQEPGAPFAATGSSSS
jgi:hypothetical protein